MCCSWTYLCGVRAPVDEGRGTSALLQVSYSLRSGVCAVCASTCNAQWLCPSTFFWWRAKRPSPHPSFAPGMSPLGNTLAHERRLLCGGACRGPEVRCALQTSDSPASEGGPLADKCVLHQASGDTKGWHCPHKRCGSQAVSLTCSADATMLVHGQVPVAGRGRRGVKGRCLSTRGVERELLACAPADASEGAGPCTERGRNVFPCLFLTGLKLACEQAGARVRVL